MIRAIKSLLATLAALIVSLGVFAQDEIEMADKLYESGRIYVVVIVIAIIFVGLFVYLFSIDRKIGKLEKSMEDQE